MIREMKQRLNMMEILWYIWSPKCRATLRLFRLIFWMNSMTIEFLLKNYISWCLITLVVDAFTNCGMLYSRGYVTPLFVVVRVSCSITYNFLAFFFLIGSCESSNYHKNCRNLIMALVILVSFCFTSWFKVGKTKPMPFLSHTITSIFPFTFVPC